ncbi:MAG: hypothetical protein PHS49_02900 [Candidatus Gracilibacteria bacterium]|nr:hypothetical protein [Candidatus Gracilibacteria bacterium]
MNREQKLQKVKEQLETIANLDNSFGINKKILRELYVILSEIKNPENFDITYEAILENFTKIFLELEKLGKKIDNIHLQRDQEINSKVKQINLSALNKTQFNK